MNNLRRGQLFEKLFQLCGRSFGGKCHFSALHVFKLKSHFGSTFPHSLSVVAWKRSLHAGYCLQSSVNVTSKEELDNNSETKNYELELRGMKYSELAEDDEKKKKILLVLMEHEVAKLEGKKVPSKISIEDMRELLSMYSFSSRIKYMGFLFEKELKKASDRRKREIRQKEREEWLIEKEKLKPPEHIQYGIGHNTMIVRVRRKSVMRYYNQRLANSVLYGQKMIIDMDYDCFMRKQDCLNCGEQLLEMYSVNRRNLQPYDLYFCNADMQSSTMAALSRYMPNLYAPDNFITLSHLSYLDLFPKEKLVYVTPHAKEPMRTYDHNAIYIIGR